MRWLLGEDYVAAERYDDAINLCDETFNPQKVPWYYQNNVISIYPCVTELIRIKAQARKKLGDNVAANVNYGNLIFAYELKRKFLNDLDDYDDESKSRWFAEIIPYYKETATVALSADARYTNFAFYCMEFCKGRNLIDRYDDLLVAKNYMLTPSEKDILAQYENFTEALRDISEYAEATNGDNLFLTTKIFMRTYTLSADYSRGLCAESILRMRCKKMLRNRIKRARSLKIST